MLNFIGVKKRGKCKKSKVSLQVLVQAITNFKDYMLILF